MRQATELSRVKARIKALAEKTVSNGCTEAEAIAAAEMVGRLLERYALSMEEIDVREQRCIQVEVPIGGKRRRPIDACVTAIARFCDCKVWVSRDTVMPSYVFFGFDADTAMASYLFTVIDRAMATALTAFRTAQPRLRGVGLRGASRSFQQGMAVRVADCRTTLHRHGSHPGQTAGGRRCLPGDRDPARGNGGPESRTSERGVPAWTGRR